MVKHLAIHKEATSGLRARSHPTFSLLIACSFKSVALRITFHNDHFFFHNEIQITHFNLSS
ncbi:hypothetical protein SAMN05216168_2499 [Kosakonia radicincitans]|nr:hypothetical protein SAMN03159294_4882 [Kosakonia radicincitans]SKC17749.1 hypothetical protein SAMN05216168_2499 [Kosakonia radicincitans]